LYLIISKYLIKKEILIKQSKNWVVLGPNNFISFPAENLRVLLFPFNYGKRFYSLCFLDPIGEDY
jgi:hypothetical protein